MIIECYNIFAININTIRRNTKYSFWRDKLSKLKEALEAQGVEVRVH